MINSVVIVGRVGQDPEVRYFDSGKVKTVLSVATNRWSKDGDKTDWFRIELWDKKAEVAGEYAKKGALVAVEGRLAASKWQTKEGETREYYYILANDLRLLGKREAQ